MLTRILERTRVRIEMFCLKILPWTSFILDGQNDRFRGIGSGIHPFDFQPSKMKPLLV